MLVGFAVSAAVGIGLWVAIHRVAWLGPSLANGLRSVIGADAVSKLEEFAYGVEDRWNRLWRRHEAPKAYWAPAPANPEPHAEPSQAAPQVPTVPAYRPPDVGPFDAKHAAPGDGTWVPVVDPERADEQPLLFKTLIHPDAARPWAELFVVAFELGRTRLEFVVGTVDPEATTAAGRAYARSGIIPEADQSSLLLAFNGGFKTEHGHYGATVDGIALIAPRPDVCTIAAYRDQSVRIETWRALAATEQEMRWWRQTPPCMVEQGKIHPGLASDENTNWGAALGGDTVIRRSAVALDETGRVLFVGISNSTTAPAIARGMQHAGAHDVAQLDVNWSYPKIVVFRRGASGVRETVGLFPGFVYAPDEYLRARSPRDFFYVVRRGGGSARR